jgi:uncharacterized protein involved in exopolysaccharide biosynthesis
MDAPDWQRGQLIMHRWKAVFEDTWINQVLNTVMRQRLIVVRSTALLFTCALLAAFLLPRQYTANALILVDESESQLVGIASTSSVDTEVEILYSSSVTLGAIQKLGLWNDPEFGIETGILSRLARLLSQKTRIPASINSLNQLPSGAKSKLVKNVSDNVRIFQRGLTSTITVRATSSDAAKAARLANAIAESYFELQAAARARSASRAADFLRLRVNELADEIRLDNERLNQFLATHGNMNLGPNSLSQPTEDAQGILQHQAGNGTQTDSNLDRVPLDRPDVTLSESLSESVVTDYYRLQRSAETNRKLYDSYVARLSDVQQKIGLALPNSRLVAPAITPHESSFPPTALIIFLGIILGLGAGISLALVREYFRGSFSFPHQLQDADRVKVGDLNRDIHSSP